MRPGAVLSEAWELYKAQWVHVVTIALFVFVTLSFLAVVLIVLFGWVGLVLSNVLSLIGLFWLQGALVEAVDDIRDGRVDLTVGQTFARAREHLGAIGGAGLLASIGIVLGLVLLVVPGLVLLTWWSLIVPVIVLERTGVLASFARSRELVRGHGWEVFMTILLTILVFVLARLALLIVLAPLPVDLAAFLNSIVGNAVIAPYLALAWTLMYYHLAGRRSDAGAAAA